MLTSACVLSGTTQKGERLLTRTSRPCRAGLKAIAARGHEHLVRVDKGRKGWPHVPDRHAEILERRAQPRIAITIHVRDRGIRDSTSYTFWARVHAPGTQARASCITCKTLWKGTVRLGLGEKTCENSRGAERGKAGVIVSQPEGGKRGSG